MQRTKIAEILSSKKISGRFTLMGWVRTRRDSKTGFSFIKPVVGEPAEEVLREMWKRVADKFSIVKVIVGNSGLLGIVFLIGYAA